MRAILQAGIALSQHSTLSAAHIPFSLSCFRCVRLAHLISTENNCFLNHNRTQEKMYRRKGKYARRPLVLHYDYSSSWRTENRISLLRLWIDGNSDLTTEFTTPLQFALQRALLQINHTAPAGSYFYSDSRSIGGYKDLLNLQFDKEWMMRSLDWDTEDMLRVYCNRNIATTPDSH